jgi:hypothetical protein
MNLSEQTNRIKKMMGLLSEQKISNDKPAQQKNTPLIDADQKCMTKVNKNTLEQAKKWWKDWLNNPLTKQKFKKDSNLSDDDVNNIFKYYDTILNGIRNLKYHTNFIERNDAVMYIKQEDQTTVNVNCKSALDYSDKEVLAIMAHEMQHVLEDYYPLVQNKTLQRDFNATKNEFGDYSSNNLNKKNINNSYELMKKEGFDIHGLDFYLHKIDTLDKNKQTGYFQNPSEIRSIITGIRNELGKTQGNDITIDEIKKLVASKSEGNVVHLMGVAMMSGKSMTDTLKSINSYAVNDTNPNQEKTA